MLSGVPLDTSVAVPLSTPDQTTRWDASPMGRELLRQRRVNILPVQRETAARHRAETRSMRSNASSRRLRALTSEKRK